MKFSSWLSWLRGVRRPAPPRGRKPSAGRRRAVLGLEPLETRAVLSAATISGYVYDDANANGFFDPGEQPLANSRVQLLDAANRTVDTVTTDARGYYEFNHDPAVVGAPSTLSQQVLFPEAPTAWGQTGTARQFDPALGTLTAVELVTTSTLTSAIRVESMDVSPSRIDTTVSGTVTVSGPGLGGLTTELSGSRSFDAAAFDGVIDFGGASGRDFGPVAVEELNSAVLTAAADLAAFTGTDAVTFTATARDSSAASGSANLLLSLRTKAAGEVQVIYHYLPSSSLKPGPYTIVQLDQPAGYFDGHDARGGVLLPGSAATDAIPVTLGEVNLTDNNFGEVVPAAVAGSVYIDGDNNGVRAAGETGLFGATVVLAGTNDMGQQVQVTRTTAADGTYHFAALRPGYYSLWEVQPYGCYDGTDRTGTAGGTAGNDQLLDITVCPAVVAHQYDFGELAPSSLAGYVYVDPNNNGVREAGEAGVANALVTLSGVDIYGNAVAATRLTAADGSYFFDWLTPGSYQLTLTPPAGYWDGIDTIGSQGGAVAQDQLVINLGPGVAGVDNNFAVLPPPQVANPDPLPPDPGAPPAPPAAVAGKHWFLASSRWRTLRR